ncbi:hypothetical protein [Streptomyces sp. NPDC090036]|uniref:hypothetical protein n=1 Tax=Streptomyces sp. NPDC090036 TaxID=3365926 RepID=UPI00382964BD
MAGKQNEKRHEKRHEKRKSAKSEKSEKPAKAGKRSDGGGDGARPSLRELLRVPPGERPDLRLLDSSGTPGGPAGKAAGLAATALLAQPLASLQERLYAASTAGDRRRVLLVLQGTDTSGKGGTVKHWKFNLGDIAERSLWPAYQEAYELALERCSTDAAPWYVVPADRKWFRNWAISIPLLEHLEEIDPRYPKGDFDVEECRRQLLEG